jgi:hypothetical protein
MDARPQNARGQGVTAALKLWLLLLFSINVCKFQNFFSTLGIQSAVK